MSEYVRAPKRPGVGEGHGGTVREHVPRTKATGAVLIRLDDKEMDLSNHIYLHHMGFDARGEIAFAKYTNQQIPRRQREKIGWPLTDMRGRNVQVVLGDTPHPRPNDKWVIVVAKIEGKEKANSPLVSLLGWIDHGGKIKRMIDGPWAVTVWPGL